MRRMLFIAVLIALSSCQEDNDITGEAFSFNDETGPGGGVPVYKEVWNPRISGETMLQIMGIGLQEDEMVGVSVGLANNARAEFRISRTATGALHAAIDIYDATGYHIDTGSRSYGVGKHTNWESYSDGDEFGMKIRIQRRKSGTYIYILNPKVNGRVAKTSAQAEGNRGSTSTSTSGVSTSVSVPPPAGGLVVFHTGIDGDGQCVGVRVKTPQSSSLVDKLPTRFASEGERRLTAAENNDLLSTYFSCLQEKGLAI